MRNTTRKLIVLLIFTGMTGFNLFGQVQINTAERMIREESRLTIGGYGQIDYNQPLESETFQNGTLDVHRLVLLFGYKFNEKTQFISEIELEHVSEVYVEQAFLQYEITPWIKFRGGLLLIPMGIINEYHEPSTFNGVERPNVDKYIVPATWREIGAGFTGTFTTAALSYQVYLVNGFNGFDGGPNLNGANGFRKARQKGAESFLSAPNGTFKINYFGIRGLQLGLSAYTGKTQSTLYNGLGKSDAAGIASADSTVVGLTLFGADARYTYEGLKFRAQANYGIVSNSEAYNTYTGSDLGSSVYGWYTELAYNIFHGIEEIDYELIPFLRYEHYNTHASTDPATTSNPGYNKVNLTAGVGWKIASGAMLKTDLQVFRNKEDAGSLYQLNAGVAVWF